MGTTKAGEGHNFCFLFFKKVDHITVLYLHYRRARLERGRTSWRLLTVVPLRDHGGSGDGEKWMDIIYMYVYIYMGVGGHLPCVEILEPSLAICYISCSPFQDCKTISTFSIFGMDCDVCRI